jgi:type IV secretion system protein VirB11
MSVEKVIANADAAAMARVRELVPGYAKPVFAGISADTTVVQYMKPLRGFLDMPGVTEVCVNRPGIVFVEVRGVWQRFEVPELSFKHCRSLAGAVATLTGQYTNEAAPLLGAQLPTGERVQFVQPCAVPAGTVAICIRKPSSFRPNLRAFEEAGLFKRIKPLKRELEPFEEELLALKDQCRYAEFFEKAVRRKQTIAVGGKTGSGKTTFMKGLVEEVPLEERLIGIEDAAENDFPSHENKLNLFYSKNAQGASDVSAKQLLEACLRLRPDRIFLSEIRGEEAYYFFRLAASGHPGSITSLHAGSCELAFEQMALMVRESSAGGGMTMPEIKQFARDVIDIVVHFDNDDGGRHITGIHYDPRARLNRMAA